MDATRIDRINELYHKSQSVGLTVEEKEEQQKLRKEYVAAIRANVRSQLNNIDMQREAGTNETLGATYGNRK